MKTKVQKIISAYGTSWWNLSRDIDTDGWLEVNETNNINLPTPMDRGYRDGKNFYRPSILRGIEKPLTKQDVIEEAYGDQYSIVKNNIDENGCLCRFECIKLGINTDNMTIIDFDVEEDQYDVLVPNSIVGINNNNGWIKIINKISFANIDENLMYETYDITGWFKSQIISGTFLRTHFERESITHYKVFEPKKLPVY